MTDVSTITVQVHAPNAPVQIAMFGPPEVRWYGRPLMLARRQTRALLYRIAAATVPVPRDQVCFLLWPDVPDTTARRNLTVLLNQLRRALPVPEALVTVGDSIALDRSTVWVDATAVERAITTARRTQQIELLTAAVELYRGPFLDGFTLPASPEWEDWADGERQHWERRYLEALTTLIEAYTARGAYQAAIATAQRYLATDALAEEVHRQMIALYAATGDRTAALRQFEQCAMVLERDLGVNPLPQTRAVYEAVRDGHSPLQEHPIGPRDVELDGTFRWLAVSDRPLPDDQLPAAGATASPTLPVPPNPLIGRADEVAAACAMMQRADVRLLTLCGPGGSGKTRLALQVAWDVQASFADGVVFVPLAPLRDPDLVIDAIAQACGVQQPGAVSLISLLHEYLRDKHLLLVLDNVEHLLAAAPLIAELLASAPRLSVLVTSRTLLNLQGEYAFSVSPLPLPDLAQLPAAVELAGQPAVALLLARTRAHTPSFQLTEANAAEVAAICVHLDGLPLAIELAAARLKILSPRALLRRLHPEGTRRLALLDQGPRDLPDRHRTLRAMIDWSYRLLDLREQRLFERLAVFAGGWTLAAAEGICRAGDLPHSVLDGIQALLDANLVTQRSGSDGEPRFGMLETIREYALERLEARGTAEATAEAYAAYFCDLVETAAPHLQGSDQQIWFRRLTDEYQNIWAALHWSYVANRYEMMARMVGVLHHYWYVRGIPGEGRRWMDLVFAHRDSVPPALLAPAYNGAGVLALRQADYDQATHWQHEAFTLYQQIDDGAGMAQASIDLGLIALYTRRFAEAQNHFDRSLALEQAYGLDETTVFTLCWVAGPALYQGDHRRAQVALERALAIADRQNDTWSTAVCLMGLGQTQLVAGDYFQAQQYYAQALELVLLLDAKEGICWVLEGLAGAAAGQHDPVHTAHLFGAAEALRETIGAPIPPHIRDFYAPFIAKCRADLDAVTFRTAWQAGRGLTVEQAVAEARTDISAAELLAA